MIEGDKVILRSIVMEDTPLIVKWRNTPAVRNNFLFRQTFTEEIHRNWMHSKIETGEAIQFMVIDRGAQRAVGSVYLRDVDKTACTAEFGIFIGDAQARGRGIGTEAAMLVTDYGFECLHLKKIFLRVLCNNSPAIHSYEKCGFVRLGEPRFQLSSDGTNCQVMFMVKERKGSL